jgi:catechol 2,3-dioxygenase-like lactoylglutathione lyase family enzyme
VEFKEMKLWHAGIAVKDLRESIRHWESLGFSIKQQFEKDEPAAHAALMVDDQGTGVELWQFTGDSPLNKYIGRHIAFMCDDAQATAQKFLSQGFKEVIPYTKGVMVSYIFLEDEFGTYFEFAEVKDGKWKDD